MHSGKYICKQLFAKTCYQCPNIDHQWSATDCQPLPFFLKSLFANHRRSFRAPWTIVHGPAPWTMVHGRWSMDHGLWLVHGPSWTAWSTFVLFLYYWPEFGLDNYITGPNSGDQICVHYRPKFGRSNMGSKSTILHSHQVSNKFVNRPIYLSPTEFQQWSIAGQNTEM